MSTIEAVLRIGARRLASAGIAQPGLDARLLLGHIMRVDQAALIVAGSRQIDTDQARRFARALARREQREPVSRIIGAREFYSRNFFLSPQVLDPRPDSECLVEAALKLAGNLPDAPRLLDLGTGSGCLLITLLAEIPRATGVGIDISAAALSVARHNAARHGVAARAEFVASDWCAAIAGSFEMIVANPPYIARQEIAGLAPEVRDFDPRRALDGGVDGFDAIRKLAPGAAKRLDTAGLLLVEIGHGQARHALAIMAEHGFAPLHGSGIGNDLAGRERVLTLRKS